MFSIAKNPFVRKGSALLKKIPRSLIRRAAVPEFYVSDPPILCNSFPKSGTHLLKQVLSVFPDMHDFGSFIATQPTLSVSKTPLSTLQKKINGIVPSELVCSHLEYDAALSISLDKKNAVHYFIYRDLRDVVVSEAYYLTHMNKWHRLHKFYSQLPDMESRNSLCISGGRRVDGLPFDYQNVGDRFRSYMQWITSAHCYPVRFEDLVGPNQQKTVRCILDHYLQHSNKKIDLDELVNASLRAIRPQKSHTFREGKSGGWKEKLTSTQLQEINRLVGNELKILGYEAYE